MGRIVFVGTSKANAMDSHTLSLMEVTLMSNLDCLGVLTIKFHRKDKITICYLHYSQNCSTQRILKLCDRSIKAFCRQLLSCGISILKQRLRVQGEIIFPSIPEVHQKL